LAKLIEGSKIKPGRITSCVYGLTGSAKSTLTGHLPGEGKIILLAYDQCAPGLDSIAVAERSRFLVYLPDGNAVEKPDGELVTDWEFEGSRLCQKNWVKEHPDAEAIILDAGSTLSYKLLHETAKEHPVDPGKKQMTTGETFTIGRPKPQDKESKVTNPQLGDYGLAQQQIKQLIEWLITRNPTLDIHVIFHDGMCPADKESGFGLVFGPEIVGNKGPRMIPQLFNTVLWLERERKDKGHLGEIRVALQDTDMHVAHIKTPRPSEVPVCKWLKPDPVEIKGFWSWVKGLKS
jgi:hypothetical protein